jgi:hypothetical protein
MQIPRVVALCLALFVAAASATLAQNAQKDDKKRNKQEQADTETLVALVDSAMSGAAVGVDLPTKVTLNVTKDSVVAIGSEGAVGDVPITWESAHFVKGQDGKTYVPFTIRVDPKRLSAKSVAMYVRMVDKRKPATTPTGTSGDEKKDEKKNGRVEHPWDNIHFLDVPEDGKVSRAMAVPGGEYELFVGVKDKNSGDKKQVARIGLMRKDVAVPDFAAAELNTSSIIVADAVEPIQTAMTNEQQQENPYTFGTMKIVPSTDPKFKKDGELQVVFWIYGATQDASKKPDVEIQYNFHHKTPEGEKFFNKTAPQQLNATTLPPQFDMAAGHQLPGSLVVPLTSFPPGDYRLEIKITDKPSGKSLTRDVAFSVVG